MVVYGGGCEGSEEQQEAVVSRERAELGRRLSELTRRNGYEIVQTNGQRVYGPPAAASRRVPPPPKGCEVFIGKLHKNIFEDELIPLFEKIGPLYRFRLMLDFMERTRGYAFATYFSAEDASRAVGVLNDHEIRPRCRIGVYKSVDNCRLFVGNVPADKTKREVCQMLRHYADGVVDVIMYPHYDDPALNRGFVFVEFENHRLAAMARRQFTPDNLIAWDQPLYVDWADPVPDIEPQVMAKVTILYLRNLPIHYTSEEIQACIGNIVGMRILKKVHKMVNFAFVHFVSRRAAEFAMSKLKNLIIANYQVGVEWARPRRYSKKNRLINLPENFCTSVPPNIRRLVHQRLKILNGTDDGASISTASDKSSGDGGGGAKRRPDAATSAIRKPFVLDDSKTDSLSVISSGASSLHSPLNTKSCPRNNSPSGFMFFGGSLKSQNQEETGETFQQVSEYKHFTGEPIFYNYRMF